MITISHDPVARHSMVRRQENAHGKLCRWCGGSRKRNALFRYGIQSDGFLGRTAWDERLFCSKPCRDSYMGG